MSHGRSVPVRRYVAYDNVVGPVLHDDKQLELLSRMFASITTQTKAGVEKGQSLEDIRKTIDLKEFRDSLAGDSPVRRVLFANYVKMPGTASAFADVKK